MGTDTDLGFIAPELRQFAQPIGTFKTHPDNARQHDLNAIGYSLERHGQRSPVIVQKSTGYIVKGNGTQTAAQMLGWTHLAFVEQEMSDGRALLYLRDDNKASDTATYFRKKYRSILKKLVDGPDPLMQGMFTDESQQQVVLTDLRTELADMDDEDGGEEVETDVNADFAPNTFAAKAQKAEVKLPGEKMREVPLVLAIADYNEFIVRIKALQKRYGTAGTIGTIMEAVKRQFEAEDGAEPFTGKREEAPPIAEGQVGLDEALSADPTGDLVASAEAGDDDDLDPIEDAFNHSDELLDAALG